VGALKDIALKNIEVEPKIPVTLDSLGLVAEVVLVQIFPAENVPILVGSK
jgi:hypothetical protein